MPVRRAPGSSSVPHGRGECARCLLRAIVQGDWVQLTVTDHGCGMTPEQVSAIFDGGASDKSGVHAGLGLAVVQDIVRGAGGHVCVDSAPGEGTTMTLLLPALREQRPRTLRRIRPSSSLRRSGHEPEVRHGSAALRRR